MQIIVHLFDTTQYYLNPYGICPAADRPLRQRLDGGGECPDRSSVVLPSYAGDGVWRVSRGRCLCPYRSVLRAFVLFLDHDKSPRLSFLVEAGGLAAVYAVLDDGDHCPADRVH